MDTPLLIASAIAGAVAVTDMVLTVRKDRRRRPEAACGLTLGYGDHPVFRCVLEPHAGDVHANPTAIARIDGQRWTIERGKSWSPGDRRFVFRDFMAEARAANPVPVSRKRR